MKINGVHYTSIWYEPSSGRVLYIDQTRLPHDLVIRELKNFDDGLRAITEMEVRGAPLIGVTAAFALYAGMREESPAGDRKRLRGMILDLAGRLTASRPTAVNLAWAVERMLRESEDAENIAARLLQTALAIREEEADAGRRIGENGLPLIRKVAEGKGGKPVNILTHCNAGWLATVDYGTALAPIYRAHDSGIPVHVWVDETRPRNQGAKLTVYELSRHGVPNTLIVDNASGHIMQRGLADMVIVGADRITANGDVVNKIGTYLKALAAFDNGVPFYVAAPASTYDLSTPSGDRVAIEERSQEEVLVVGENTRIAPEGTRAFNPGFDVTPARLVTGYINS